MTVTNTLIPYFTVTSPITYTVIRNKKHSITFVTQFPREGRLLAPTGRSVPPIGADPIDAGGVGALEGFRPAPWFDPRHLLFDSQPRKVDQLLFVHPHTPYAPDVVLGVSRPQVPGQTVGIVDGPEEEKRSQVQGVVSANEILLSFLLIQGQLHRPFYSLDP